MILPESPLPSPAIARKASEHKWPLEVVSFTCLSDVFKFIPRRITQQRLPLDHLFIERLAFGTKNRNWADGVSDS